MTQGAAGLAAKMGKIVCGSIRGKRFFSREGRPANFPSLACWLLPEKEGRKPQYQRIEKVTAVGFYEKPKS